jgi:outer membrane protein assembly factor BamB
MRKLATLLPALLSSLHLHAAESEWPQFRGPRGDGSSLATDLPLEWSSEKNVAWRVQIPGKGWSSPVLSKGRLYLTSAVSSETGTHLHALCLDAQSGALLWNTPVVVADPAAAAAIHRKNSLASPTPIVTDSVLFAHFGHMGTAALDLSGRILWKQETLGYQPVHGAGGSPVLVENRLIFSADGREKPVLTALDARSGALLWQTPRNSPAKKQFSFSTPAVITADGILQIISPASGFVGSYAPEDGRELWRVTYGEGYSVIPKPVHAHGLLFLGSGYDAPSFYAVKPQGASGDATASHVAWTLKKGAPHTPSALVVGNEIYLVSDSGIATCADAVSGTVHWTERLGGNFSASPFAAGDRLYFLSESGETSVLKAGTTFQLLARNPLGERTLASCVPADHALYLRSEEHLFKIGR